MVSNILNEHRRYLADRARLSAFERAIAEVVQPGSVVLDLGAGTGILGMLACRAGAARVYSIDRGGIIELARELYRVNGFADRVDFIRGMSTEVDLPEKVDVVVADQIEGLGYEAGLLHFFDDARERFLKPGGAMIPSRVDLFLAPVESAEARSHIEFWSSAPAGFDFRGVRARAENANYLIKLDREQLLGEPVLAASLTLTTATPAALELEASFTVSRPGTVDGIGGWCSVGLSSNVDISNSPLAATPVDRLQAFFPIERPLAVARGDRIRITMRVTSLDIVNWKVEVRGNGAGRARFDHSTFKGMFISKEEIEKSGPGFVPRLSSRGQARLLVLRMCDGRKTVRQIEREVRRQHPELFRSLDATTVFVGDLVSRHSV